MGSDISALIETDRTPVEVPRAPWGEVEDRIALNVQHLIPDRSTLQVGIGAVPEAIVASLRDRKDLGVHSGMIGDSIVDLFESGALTNAHKEIDTGLTVTGSLIGTARLYRFADHNKSLLLTPSSYTHATSTVAQLKRFVSLNSALEVDLTGQVNAEAVGKEYIGAVGGQVDYVRASAYSEHGTSIIALPATGKKGDSRIVAKLSGPVTTSRSDVDVVVTEYGAVRLRGLSLIRRVRGLISIAAPEHREELLRCAREFWPEV